MRITFTGDILCYESQIQSSKIGKKEYDFSSIFKEVSPYLKDSDYVCGSLETPVADSAYTSSDINFNTPYEFLGDLAKSGFDMLTTGNNHCLDRGVIGLKNTIHALDYFKLDHTGTYLTQEDSDRIFIKDIGDIKIAFLSFTYGTNSRSNKQYLDPGSEYMVDLLRKQDRVTVQKATLTRRIVRRLKRLILCRKPVVKKKGAVRDSVNDKEILNPENKVYIDRFVSKIRRAKQEADLVVLCMHSGGQFNYDLGVGAYTEYIVRTAMENGVDIIVGNHAHCVMPAGFVDADKFVSYALGNFSFTPGEGYYVDGVYADYSVLLHVDIHKVESLHLSVSFSVLKSVKTPEGGSVVYNVYDLYKNEKDSNARQILERDNQEVVSRFTKKNEKVEISLEYKF